jgi:hypothetical protein
MAARKKTRSAARKRPSTRKAAKKKTARKATPKKAAKKKVPKKKATGRKPTRTGAVAPSPAGSIRDLARSFALRHLR